MKIDNTKLTRLKILIESAHESLEYAYDYLLNSKTSKKNIKLNIDEMFGHMVDVEDYTRQIMSYENNMELKNENKQE